MKTILLLYGGRSYEHDVSVISAVQIGELWRLPDCRLVPVYLRGEEAVIVKDWMRYTSYTAARVKGRRCRLEKGGIVVGGKHIHATCALLATHGGDGEDGTLQALLQYYQIPYTSPDAVASGICMDKILCKTLLSALGFSVVAGGGATLSEVPPLPCIVKPARLGSSIGISVAHTAEEWRKAYYEALQYDDSVLYEAYLPHVSEFNCAAVRDGENIVASAVERPQYTGETFTFGDKYKSDVPHELPAAIDDDLRRQIRSTTVRIYKALRLNGVVRVDYLWDNTTLYVNEINTIPGALAYRLFSVEGLSFGRLMQVLIHNAMCHSYPNVDEGHLLGELVGVWK